MEFMIDGEISEMWTTFMTGPTCAYEDLVPPYLLDPEDGGGVSSTHYLGDGERGAGLRWTYPYGGICTPDDYFVEVKPKAPKGFHL